MTQDLDFIRLVWQSEMFDADHLRFYPDAHCVIESRGVPIEGGQADFSDVAVRDVVSDAVSVGGALFDCRSSDWRERGDISDPKYDGIILHVVADRDVQLLRRGRVVPTCVISPDERLVDYFSRMRVDCDQAFEALEQVERDNILTRLLDERIERKAREILAIIDEQKGSWHEAAYICFMRALGSAGESKEDFESIARSLSYSTILLHAERPLLVEALMLGQAGHLDVEEVDCYVESLQREFIAARDRSGMLPAVVNWKPVRRRPYSSSPLTLARAAAILCAQENLFEDILKFDHIDDLRSLFIVDVPQYWQHHSAPMKGEGKTYGSFSRDKADTIIINFVIPMLLAHAALNSDDRLVERAIRFYEELPAEQHKFSRRWTCRSWRPGSAYDSQGLVQLGREYCERALCARCPIGRHKLLLRYKQFSNSDQKSLEIKKQ